MLMMRIGWGKNELEWLSWVLFVFSPADRLENLKCKIFKKKNACDSHIARSVVFAMFFFDLACVFYLAGDSQNYQTIVFAVLLCYFTCLFYVAL